MTEKDIEFLHEMFPLEAHVIYETYISSNKNIDDTISCLIDLCKTNSKHPPTYEEAVLNDAGAGSNNSNNGELSKKRRDSRRNLGKKEWKPVILGRLSDDFLKVSNEILENSAITGFNCKGCAKLNQRESPEESYSSQMSSITSSMAMTNFGDIDSIIRKRMEDNVSQTRYATMGRNSNTESIQYLDDERLALMLQNQEFRAMVKADPEFKQALQEDIKEGEDEDTEEINIWQERDESVRFNPNDYEMDYGYARSSIVDPDEIWPDRPTVPNNNDVTAMVKAMGKASKKRLNSIARRFSSMRRSRGSRSYADVDSFAEFEGPTGPSSRWETESTQGLLVSDSTSRRESSPRHPMSVISERSLS